MKGNGKETFKEEYFILLRLTDRKLTQKLDQIAIFKNVGSSCFLCVPESRPCPSETSLRPESAASGFVSYGPEV
jgi:hypothetical protein